MKQYKNKKLIFLLTIITGLFLLISLYLVYFQLFKASELNNHPRNARNFADEKNIKRGSIYDKYGKLLTYSEDKGNGYERFNTYNLMYSNIIGYSKADIGKSGIEAAYNQDLLGITSNKDIFTKLDSIVSNTSQSDLYLTINDKVQSYLWDILGDYKGSIIITKPKTGEIVAMVSKPSFNVNKVSANWDKLISSEEGVLLNRSTQGMYEPGSIFKVLTSIVFLRNDINLYYNDTGEATIGNFTVTNFNEKSYGEMDLEKALNVSSNTYFFEKSKEVTNKMFLDVIEDFGIGKDYDFPIPSYKSQFPFKTGLSDLEKANAAFGQGKTYVTPMDMMLVTMGIANQGVVYKPYIIDKIDRKGIETFTQPQILSAKIESNYANLVREYMKSTAEYNGFSLKNGISLAGKTGSAQTSNELKHTWYMAMAPAEDPEYAILVTIENINSTASSTAVPIAIKALNYIFSLD